MKKRVKAILDMRLKELAEVQTINKSKLGRARAGIEECQEDEKKALADIAEADAEAKEIRAALAGMKGA